MFLICRAKHFLFERKNEFLLMEINFFFFDKERLVKNCKIVVFCFAFLNISIVCESFVNFFPDELKVA